MSHPLLRIVSLSGGKDSTALYCWAIRQFGRDGFKAVFADTGHEHPVTYNYVRNLPMMAGGPDIQWVRADFSDRLAGKGIAASGNPFLDMMLWKGRAPSAKAQFCTEHVKLHPIRQWIESIRQDDEVNIYLGIRAGESPRRAKMPEREFSEFYDGLCAPAAFTLDGVGSVFVPRRMQCATQSAICARFRACRMLSLHPCK